MGRRRESDPVERRKYVGIIGAWKVSFGKVLVRKHKKKLEVEDDIPQSMNSYRGTTEKVLI